MLITEYRKIHMTSQEQNNPKFLKGFLTKMQIMHGYRIHEREFSIKVLNEIRDATYDFIK